MIQMLGKIRYKAKSLQYNYFNSCKLVYIASKIRRFNPVLIWRQRIFVGTPLLRQQIQLFFR